MEAKPTYDPRDLTVHLRDAALYILVRWRLWLVAALVGALLLTVGWYAVDWRTYEMGQTAPEPLTALSEDARARVAAAMGYQAAYRRICAYNEAAPLMQIDPGAAHTRRMRLLITGEGSWTAAHLYREHVESEGAYRELAEQPTGAPYLAELVAVSVESEPTQIPQRVFLTIQVQAPTEELCNRLSSVVRRTVEEAVASVTAAVGEHTYAWAYDRYAVLQDEAVAIRQQENLASQSTLGEQYDTAYRALTAAEKEYVMRLLGQTAATDPATPPILRKTAWVWGFLLGGVVGLVWLAVRYLFCGRVLSAADVVSRHGIAVVGVLGKRPRRWRRLYDRVEEEPLVWQRIAVTAVREGVSHLYVSAPPAWQERLPHLAAALATHHVLLSVGDSPCTDGTAAQTMAACDGLVVAVERERTAHRAIAEDVAQARQWGIPVLGVLLWQ